MRSTQIEKILKLMIRQKGKQEWFYAPDFQRPNMAEDLFVGYEASARMSDLMRDFPQVVEYKREGKYRYIRFRFENLKDIYAGVPEFSDMIREEMRKVDGALI